jgi:predicted DNA-binding protein
MKESFKIDSEIKNRLGKQAKKTGRTMTGLANLLLDSKLKEMEAGYEVYGNDYTNNMTHMLGEAINGTRKNKRK